MSAVQTPVREPSAEQQVARRKSSTQSTARDMSEDHAEQQSSRRMSSIQTPARETSTEQHSARRMSSIQTHARDISEDPTEQQSARRFSSVQTPAREARDEPRTVPRASSPFPSPDTPQVEVVPLLEEGASQAIYRRTPRPPRSFSHLVADDEEDEEEDEEDDLCQEELLANTTLNAARPPRLSPSSAKKQPVASTSKVNTPLVPTPTAQKNRRKSSSANMVNTPHVAPEPTPTARNTRRLPSSAKGKGKAMADISHQEDSDDPDETISGHRRRRTLDQELITAIETHHNPTDRKSVV